MKVLIPLAGLIDKDAELARLEKEIGKTNNEVSRLSGKLSNPNFVDKAPEAVVNKEKEKLAEMESKLANLNAQKEKIAAL
jgi:valyl-tRNA synthetase